MIIPSRWRSRIGEPQVLFSLVAVVMLGAIWGTAFKFREVQRTHAVQAAVASSRELTETYEAQVVRALGEIDSTLKVVEFAMESHGDADALSDLAARELLPSSLLFTVNVTNALGDTIATTGAQGTENARGQDYFEAPRSNDAGMVVSRPHPSASGVSQLHFSRGLQIDGEFAGIVTVVVDAAYFVSGYEDEKLGRRGMLGLLGTDGVFRARRTADVVTSGGRVDFDAILERAGPDASRSDAWINPWDSERRYTRLRPLYDLPLAVIVGLSEHEQLEPAKREGQKSMGWAAAASALLLLFLAVLGRTSWQLARTRQRAAAEHIAHAEQVQHLAYHDSLTGLPNRSLFSKLLTQGLAEADRGKHSLAVLFLDLDRFKQINDTLGHEAGDQLLKTVGARLSGCLRASDTVARLGGDEFVVLLRDVEHELFVANVATKILASISRPFLLLNQECRITASIGISLYPRDGHDEETLKKNADIAMYQAKSEGKNTFKFYSEALNTGSLERLALESSLRHALEREEFELHYQARRETASGVITGMEALVRWNHPDLGLVAPMRFIPIAEESGLIIAIGNWVLRTACRQNVDWQSRGMPPLIVAVNLTARQFTDEYLVDDLDAILRDCGMAPALLELEITEGLLTNQVERTLHTLIRLKKLGVRIAIDDFGVGYASIAALQRFPIDTIKIDRSFIRDVALRSEDAALAEAVIAMGRSLSLTVVAQGVETRAQVEFLREHACDEFQGFYFNRPVPATEFEALMQPAALPVIDVFTD